MEIRKASLKDIPSLLEIESYSFTSDLWNEEMLTYELTKNNTSIFYVGVIDNEIVGYINVWNQFDTSSICQIATKKEYRNKGIAIELYNFVEKILKELNIEYVTLEVRKSNIAAIKLYEKLGFKYICDKVGYYKDGEDALYYVKEILWSF